jgi:hypothetical protein
LLPIGPFFEKNPDLLPIGPFFEKNPKIVDIGIIQGNYLIQKDLSVINTSL